MKCFGPFFHAWAPWADGTASYTYPNLKDENGKPTTADRLIQTRRCQACGRRSVRRVRVWWL